MFRSFLSEGRKAFALVNLKSNYCSKPRAFPEINQVTLVGTLTNDAFTLQSGTKNLTVKVCDASGQKYQTLNVHTKGFENLKTGQRVHVSGKLRSIPVELENGKRRNQLSVVANRLFVLDDQSDSENTTETDINQIDIVANVASVGAVNDGVHIFNLATHFLQDNDNGIERKTHFHSVFVFDEHLKKVSENLRIRDKVAVHGELRSATNTLSDGKKKYSGFIVAKSIEKVHRRAQQLDEDDAEHEANN